MKTELFSISKIFTERLLRIPDYQRGYAWTGKQLKDFWHDLHQVEDGHNHYVGVVTLENVSNDKCSRWEDDEWIIKSKNYEPLYIVDGQQRLTTTIILIQCILECIGDNPINYTTPDEIRKKFIFESKDGGISRSYLFGYEVDNPSYEFLKQNIFRETSDYQGAIQETIYTNNLLNAKNFFLEKLKELELSEIESIYSKVTQNFLFNIYSMSEEIDVHVSFETMNNRGKPLSHLELLKNRLIYLSTKIDEPDYERQKLRNAINECWKAIYHQLGRNKDNPLDDDDFLKNHFILFYGNANSRSNNTAYTSKDIDYKALHYIQRSYKEYLLETKFTTTSLKSEGDDKLTLSELYKYVSSLKSSVEKWYEISNPIGSTLDPEVVEWLEKLNKIRDDSCLPLIMVAIQKVKSTNTVVKLIKALDRLIFASSFGARSYQYGWRALETDFKRWALELSEGKSTIESVISKIDSTKEEFMSMDSLIKSFSRSLKDGGFYRWRMTRYFLYEYEEYLRSKSKTYTPKLKWNDIKPDGRDHKTIEHIYPQTARKPHWKNLFSHYTDKERAILRHALGNLVPLSQPKNSSFQNKPFLEKISNDKNTVGFKYGSFSEIELTNYSQWTAIEILSRSLKLLAFMEKRWKINFGSLEEKIKFMNMQFVLQKEGLIVSDEKLFHVD
ncbi:DUF262 domain-containing protein [Vibrio neptunius]|uniref:DUF262 domain-containing protein n=1 Tax=Vibrio neptunius TaxID=170651 RepID=UPI0033152C0B